MTVYTGLLAEATDTVDGVPLTFISGSVYARPFMQFIRDNRISCRCEDPWGPVCNDVPDSFRWLPGEPVARFDIFTPPYAREVSRG